MTLWTELWTRNIRTASFVIIRVAYMKWDLSLYKSLIFPANVFLSSLQRSLIRKIQPALIRLKLKKFPFTGLRSATMEPLLWDTSIQGTSPFRGHKIWSQKNALIIFVLVTTIDGTPLFRGKGHILWVLKLGFTLHSGDTLTFKRWLTTERIHILKRTQSQ